jgi:hypothetical protein
MRKIKTWVLKAFSSIYFTFARSKSKLKRTKKANLFFRFAKAKEKF